MPLHTTQALASTLLQISFNSFSIHCPSLDKTPDVQIHHSETYRLPGKVSPSDFGDTTSNFKSQPSDFPSLSVSMDIMYTSSSGRRRFVHFLFASPLFNIYLLSEVSLWVHISTSVEICLCVPTKKPDQHAICVPDGHFYTSTLLFQRFLLSLPLFSFPPSYPSREGQ